MHSPVLVDAMNARVVRAREERTSTTNSAFVALVCPREVKELKVSVKP